MEADFYMPPDRARELIARAVILPDIEDFFVCLFKAQLDFAGSKKSVMAAGAIFFTKPMGGPFWKLSCFLKPQLDLGVPRGVRVRSVVN